MNIWKNFKNNETVLLRFMDILNQMINQDNHKDICALLNYVENNLIMIIEKKEILTKKQKDLFDIAEKQYNALYGQIDFY